MAYFPVGDTPQQDSLPALQGLAREFLICDNWFSSMPGPTWPNRFFIHSGTRNMPWPYPYAISKRATVLI